MRTLFGPSRTSATLKCHFVRATRQPAQSCGERRRRWCLLRVSFSKLLSLPSLRPSGPWTGDSGVPSSPFLPLLATATVIVVPFIRLCANFPRAMALVADGWQSFQVLSSRNEACWLVSRLVILHGHVTFNFQIFLQDQSSIEWKTKAIGLCMNLLRSHDCML